MKKPTGAKEIRTRHDSDDAQRLSPPQVTVLHVDDDPNDTELLRAATRKAGLTLTLQNVEDGEEALAYLRGTGIYANRALYQMPSLILLDLKMPRATGFEVLKWIRTDPTCQHLPVVVLSGSELQDDIREAYEHGANSYLVKPLAFDALVSLVRSVQAVWLMADQSASRTHA